MNAVKAAETEQKDRVERWDVYDLEMLDRIQRRVLWLATYMVHYANDVRPHPDKIKVGGHQASSASVVTLLTALYFHFLRSGDRVSIKPHASPVFHAIQFLRGLLPQEKLLAFRQYGGLQAYPSRTKDPDGVDFSTGSVGLGAVAPIFGALVRDYIVDHFGTAHAPWLESGWHIALVGDAELDEGNVWEALGEEYTQRLGRVLWIVDLNRQSLDRVVPDGRAQKLREMFWANSWKVIDLKYGKRLEAVFRRSYGLKLRAQIDEMSNEEYQSLLLQDGESIRARLIHHAGNPDHAMAELLADYGTAEIKELLANLGGHDLERVMEAYAEAFAVEHQPVVILAYTIKGWGLPFAGNPGNHARLLKPAEVEALRQRLGIPVRAEWAAFPPDSEEGQYVRAKAAVGGGSVAEKVAPAPAVKIEIPVALGGTYKGMLSTQTALGSLLVALSRHPHLASHLVTVSPDVAISTSLAGWIHKAGVYSRRHIQDYFARERGASLLINWRESPQGHHIELGISENNLFLLLAVLGLADDLYGQPLLPIGTVYDPFVCRALDAFLYAAYSRSRFIIAGTPSGVSLSYEGGAHQSILTPAIGVQLPGVTYYEPAFALELEWMLLAALRALQDRENGKSTYLRLSTKPVDQELFNRVLTEQDSEALRRQVLRGGYRLVDSRKESDYRPGKNVVHLFVSGALVPEAVAAIPQLQADGIVANVFHVTSADLLFQDALAAQKERRQGKMRASWIEELVPVAERKAPVVTVQDGHPHTLSFVGGVLETRMVNLGVTEFGQSGAQDEVYRAHGIDTDSIVQAAAWLVKKREYCPRKSGPARSL
jgi:pyruvate dehydrogenase E1 component